MTTAAIEEIILEIGEMPILLRTKSSAFLNILEHRYRSFMSPRAHPAFELDVEISASSHFVGKLGHDDDDLSVRLQDQRWILQRGDFYAELDLASKRGRTHQELSPFAIDATLRILHSLLLAPNNGLLIHAASVLRNGHSFLFVGVSGAGKTTMCRIAPPDAITLTDEISYVRERGGQYYAYGTPFSGELGRPGDNVSGPLRTIYLLAQGTEHRIDDVSKTEAVKGLMQSVLFFARDTAMVNQVFMSACCLANTVQVKRLTFLNDSAAWELIR